MKTLIFSLIACIFFLTTAWSQSKNRDEESKLKSTECGGVERWTVKVLTDPDVGSINFNPVITTVNGMVSIVTPSPSTTMPRYAGIEDKTYKLVCKITIKKDEEDDDYHLVLSDGIHTFIGEIPNAVCATAATSSYVNQYISCRNFIDSHIPQGNVNNVNIPDVEVTGVAFIDPPHGQTGKAPNNIEFHPVLDIHFYSATGISDESVEKLLAVSTFPNPAHNTVNFSMHSSYESLQNCSLQLFDSQAQCIKVFELPVSGHQSILKTLDVSGISAGIYIYTVSSKGKHIYDGKLIIN